MSQRVIKSDEFILEEHLSKITDKPCCALCQASLKGIENESRGIVEFYDGWFWICPQCKVLMPEFDETQCKPWVESEIIPYFQRSRRFWLPWLKKEFGKEI